MEPRRLQAAKSLLKHSLFGFQVYDTAISKRLGELKELLLATCGEMDQIALLSESIRGIKEQLQSRSEKFLLEPLRRFEQDMELLLDVWSGDDVEEQHENLIDDDTEKSLLLSQDSVDTLTTPQSSPTCFQFTRTNQMIAEDEAIKCGVCWAHDSLENDPIVCCDVCGVAVHRTCYRLAVVPKGNWYCIPCKLYMASHNIESNLLPTREIECEACCLKGGAMVPTIGAGWVHVACFMFLPELHMQDKHASRCQGLLDNYEVVCGVNKLKARRKLRCCFCKKNYAKGACAQCAVGKCTVAYHALCALQNGIKLRYFLCSLAVDVLSTKPNS